MREGPSRGLSTSQGGGVALTSLGDKSAWEEILYVGEIRELCPPRGCGFSATRMFEAQKSRVSKTCFSFLYFRSRTNHQRFDKIISVSDVFVLNHANVYASTSGQCLRRVHSNLCSFMCDLLFDLNHQVHYHLSTKFHLGANAMPAGY